MSETPPWLFVTRHEAPLILSMPHTGIDIPADLESRFVSPWLARKDADWWVDRIYDFAFALGATMIRTCLSRSVIDVNRDPFGRSLYPGQNTTELCPTTTFDGEPLYHDGLAPDAEEIARRRRQYFDPYHAAIAAEIARLRGRHPKIVLFEAHSIRSRIPRLFDGGLPHFNIGTNSGASCAAELTAAIEDACDASPAVDFPPPRAGEVARRAGGESLATDDSPLRLAALGTSPARGGGKPHAEVEISFTRVTNGRFKGGYTTRHHGDPARGVHAVQLELAMRGYMEEPETPSQQNWPAPYDPVRVAPLRAILERILETGLSFARSS
ncbi:MAG TPA: N-formylglutamate deformylase [Rhizomicrobium sp.]|nr:N-formylglutamate deformylase [Rhizomicrobium sp.]